MDDLFDRTVETMAERVYARVGFRDLGLWRSTARRSRGGRLNPFPSPPV
jgi:hypothetical protein